MRFFPERPMRLPRMKPYVPKASDPSIFWFNGERQSIVREVANRATEAQSKNSKSLELALNEVAYHEVLRLARQKDQESKDNLGFWRSLKKRVGRMNDAEKVQTLRKISHRMAQDIAGNFDPRVYKFSEKMVPRLLTAVMNPRSKT